MEGMEATAKNEKTARDIINVLAENKCTVNEALEILDFVRHAIKDTTIQGVDRKLFELEV